MDDTGIAAAAIAWPSLTVASKEMKETWGRAPRGIDRIRATAWDEDAATLAVDAAAAALAAAGQDGAALAHIVVASPEPAATLVAEALGARRARILELDETSLSGLDALVAGFEGPTPALVVVAHAPRAPPGTDARLEEGAGAVAFLLRPGGGARSIATAAVARHVPGAQRRLADATPRAPLSEVDDITPLTEALAGLETPEDPLVVIGRVPRGHSAKPKRAAPDVAREAGRLGAAEVPMQLALALRQGAPQGEWVLVADGTQERGLAMALRIQGDVQHASAPGAHTEVSSVRALQESRALARLEDVPDSPMGAYVPVGTWVEDLPARLRLEAQRCEGCDEVLYPPRGACPACRGARFAVERLPDEAEIYAPTRIGRGGAPSEFALEQQQVGAYWLAVVAWPGQDVKVTARLTGFADRAPAIGERVRPVVRRLFEQEGAVRYGLKFARVAE